MKKLLALVLALCMMAGVMSALAEGFTPAESYDVGERKFDGGEITTVAVAAGGGEVDTVPYNGPSLLFHEAMGFKEVGAQYVRGGSVKVSLQAAEVK